LRETGGKSDAILSAKDLIDQLRMEAGFYISMEVEANALRLAGED